MLKWISYPRKHSNALKSKGNGLKQGVLTDHQDIHNRNLSVCEVNGGDRRSSRRRSTQFICWNCFDLVSRHQGVRSLEFGPELELIHVEVNTLSASIYNLNGNNKVVDYTGLQEAA